jgi:hypothetical protein
MANPYVITCGLRRGAGHGAGNGAGNAAGHGAAAGTGDAEMFLYEFIGDLKDYDLVDLLSEDGHVVQEGYKSTDLLTRALKEFRSVIADERDEVESLLNRIFDPTGTGFAVWPFMYQCLGARADMFEFSRYTRPVLFTKLIVRLRNEHEERKEERNAKSHNHSLVVFCVSYERLATSSDVRVT